MRPLLKKLLFASTTIGIALWWFHILPRNWFVSCLALLLIAALFPVNRWTLGLSLALALLSVCRVATAWNVLFLVILPNDFEGVFTVVEHPSGTGKIETSGLWKTTVTLRVPPSGLLVVRDTLPLHYWRDDEVWRYEDGRVLKRWYDRLSPGVIKANITFNSAKGTLPSDPLHIFRDKYQMVQMLQFELRLDPATSRGDENPVEDFRAAGSNGRE